MSSPVVKNYDVIIAGGGPAGIVAAIAAARNGAKTLLVERYGFLGGQSSASLVYPWMSFHDPQGHQVIQGIAQEIVARLMAMGGSPGHVPDTIGYVSMFTPFDVEAFKICCARNGSGSRSGFVIAHLDH